MSDALGRRLLEALLDSWDRSNTILLNLLRALPEGGLEARAMEGSPSIAELLTHIHFVRLVFVSEDAPECAGSLPEDEWVGERDPGRIAKMLNDSVVTEVVPAMVHVEDRDVDRERVGGGNGARPLDPRVAEDAARGAARAVGDAGLRPVGELVAAGDRHAFASQDPRGGRKCSPDLR